MVRDTHPAVIPGWAARAEEAGFPGTDDINEIERLADIVL